MATPAAEPSLSAVRPPAPDLRDLPVIVFGMGESGVAAARFLRDRGARVVISDSRAAEALGSRLDRAQALGIEVRLGLPTVEQAAGFDLAVISPGLRLLEEPFAKYQRAGLHIVGEVELASWFCERPVIAVCGTKGKTTTATLVGAMLQAAGLSAVVGGNIGRPLVAELDAINQADVCVAEISSFQLQSIEQFRASIAVLLNITSDHLDYHATFAEYVAAKQRVFENQTHDDWAVLNADDANVMAAAAGAQSRPLLLGLRERPDVGARCQEGCMEIRLRQEDEWQTVCRLDDLPLRGDHNRANIMAASLAACAAGARPGDLAAAIRDFRLPAHIRDRVAVVNGVTFVDDTKATTPAATMAALAELSGPLILIAGGVDKGGDYDALASALADRAKGVVLIGECTPRLSQALARAGRPEVVRAGSMEAAVAAAYNMAEPGDTVLLSPACSSFDMFANAAARGEAFAHAARALGEGTRKTQVR